MLKKLVAIAVMGSALAISGCSKDAQIASDNISDAADNFQIERRIVFYNGFNSEYILTIEGRCSITKDAADNQLEVICKTGHGQYKKHFLGISDNVTYFAEQLEGASVSAYHYKVTFKPEAIIPDINLRISTQDQS